MAPDQHEIQAAGGVVVRRGEGRDHVLLVHRPKYSDWSLPKGKLEPGESAEAAAVREVEEETGLRCALGRDLGSVHYKNRRGRPKTVRWWEMEPVADAGFTPNDEVDELLWATLDEARGILSYETDRGVLDELDRSEGG